MFRPLLVILLFCVFAALFTPSAVACTSPDTVCVTNFTLTPSVIVGDKSQAATGIVSTNVSDGGVLIEISASGLYLTCLPPAVNAPPSSGSAGVFSGGCANLNGTSLSFQITGFNGGTTPQNTTISVSLAYGNTGLQQPLTINPIPDPREPVPQDPDLTCCDNYGSQPINFSNGNTWIMHQDYSIPGLGGGLPLVRTWNSLWSLAQPPEMSGIFGDSWRSNFEERIQTQSGGTVKYWKGDGSSLFFAYNTSNSSYYMTAPANDQTTLSFDSGTTLWTVTLKDGTRKIFNNSGYLTSIVDRNDNTTTINVDAGNQNRIATVTDPANRTLTFNYNTPNFPRLCSSVSDSVGTVATYTYDTLGKLTRVTYADSSQHNFSYNDPNGATLISAVTDSLGKTIEAHTYDSQRRGLTAQEANDSNGNPIGKVSVIYALYGNGYQNEIINSQGVGTILTIGNRAQRHILLSTSGYNTCSSCGFLANESRTVDEKGYTTSYADPAQGGAYVTFYTYDGAGNLISKSLPPNAGSYNTWNYTYNSFGQMLTTTDPLGIAGDPNHTTTNVYDVHGNLLSTTAPSPDGGTTPGSVTSFTYNTNGTVHIITDPLNNATTLAYNSAGLISSITDANSQVTSYTYDARGNRTSVIDPVNGSGSPTTFTYDVMNRLTSITYPGASTSVQFHYDYRGRRDWVQDQNGNKTIYAYDDADRLVSVTDAQTPTAGVTRYVYDTESHLTDIYDAKDNHTQFVWNNSFRTMTVFPSGYYETYNTNADGSLLWSTTDRNGINRSFTYDRQNRLYQWAGYLTASYDAAGHLSQVVDAVNGTWTFSYDNMGRLTQTSTHYNFLPSRTFTVHYAYDAAGNRVGMTDPENGVTQYSYDALNRLTNLQDFQSHNFGFSYDALSRRTQMTRPNGVTTNYAYDSMSHLLSVLHQAGVTTLDGAVYTYDSTGNRTSKADQGTGVTSSYGYDPIYQLTQVTQGSSTTESYTYDPVGNRLSSLGMSPYSYNASNQLTATPAATYTYDHDGNVKTKVDATGTTSYNWDYYTNRLTSVVLPGSGGTVSFLYDPFGRRIQKSFTQGSTTTTTNYLYDGANVVEELDNGGNVLARYTQGPGVDQPLSEVRSGAATYYDSDGLGSITSLTNASGTAAATYAYDAFGNLLATTGTLGNPFRYTGREFDAETGLHFYRARYYDSTLGRFISSDPIEFNGGANFYVYTGNRPLIRIDPSGLDWIYHQSSGTMNHVDDQTGETTEVCTGYAGHNFGLNNPLAQDIPGGPRDSDAGPLPQGSYTIGPLQNNVTSTGTVLPDSMRLIPDPSNDMFERSGFLIHGGNMKDRSSSQGCIVAPRDCRITIGNSNDKVLRVVP